MTTDEKKYSTKEVVAKQGELASILGRDLKSVQITILNNNLERMLERIRAIKKLKNIWAEFSPEEIEETNAILYNALKEIDDKAPIYRKWLYNELPKSKTEKNEKKLAYA